MRLLRLILFVGLFLLPLFSCNRLPLCRLRDIENYVEECPDSALVVLQTLRPILPADKARHALLTSIALDKTYNDVTDDSVARVAVRWYDSHGPADKRMKAWYYLGLVQRRSGDAAKAIVSLERALKDTSETNNLRYKGLILRNIAESYHENLNAQNAVKYCYQAIAAFEKNRDTLYANYERISLAAYYMLMDRFEQIDSVLLSLIENRRASAGLRADAALYYAAGLMSRGNDNPDTALVYYDYYRNVYKHDVPSTELMRLANAFRLCSQPDSAEACINRAFAQMKTPKDSIRWYDYQYRNAKSRQDYLHAIENLEEAVNLQNKLVEKELTQSVETEKTEYYQSLLIQREVEAKERAYQLFVLVGLLVSLSMFFVFVFKQKKKELELQITAHHELTEQLKDKSGAVISLISGRVALITKFLEQYEQLRKEPTKDSSRFDREEFAHEKIRRFQSAVSDLRKDTAFIEGLEEGLNAGKENIMCRLRSHSELRFSEEDYRILSLFFSGISGPGVSYVTGVKLATVRVKKFRYKERLEKLPDGPDKTLFLHEID